MDVMAYVGAFHIGDKLGTRGCVLLVLGVVLTASAALELYDKFRKRKTKRGG